MSNFSAISWQDQNAFWWDDVNFVLVQHARLDFSQIYVLLHCYLFSLFPANKSMILLTLCCYVLNTEAANIKKMISFKYLLVNLIWIVQFLFQTKSLVTLSFQEKIILKSLSRTKSLLNENVYDNIPLVTPAPSIMTRNIRTLAK